MVLNMNPPKYEPTAQNHLEIICYPSTMLQYIKVCYHHCERISSDYKWFVEKQCQHGYTRMDSASRAHRLIVLYSGSRLNEVEFEFLH